mmetsp:Transcript_18354/g.28180  ORF Transcript_18354/g.28180 Transcript_18354/m.28180 type:complete len:117 (+) Transcript_18354:1054-1404(+)
MFDKELEKHHAKLDFQKTAQQRMSTFESPHYVAADGVSSLSPEQKRKRADREVDTRMQKYKAKIQRSIEVNHNELMKKSLNAHTLSNRYQSKLEEFQEQKEKETQDNLNYFVYNFS